MNTKAAVETRRFRTWEDEAELPLRPWRTVFKFGMVRMWRTWYLTLLAVAALVSAALFIGFQTVEWTQHGQPTTGSLQGGIAFLIFPALVFLVLVGAPLLAEDIRFNAPLFYFSRPLRPQDYLRGKAMQLGLVLAIFGLVPIAAMMVAALPSVVTGQSTTPGTIASVGDWLVALLAALAGTSAILLFLASATICASAFTKRGWHAGVAAFAVVGSFGVLGAAASFGLKGAYLDLFGPFGWMKQALTGPWALYFRAPGQSLPDGTAAVVPICYLLLAGTSLAALLAAGHRLQDMEASA
jgi:hypothetical protein